MRFREETILGIHRIPYKHEESPCRGLKLSELETTTLCGHSPSRSSFSSSAWLYQGWLDNSRRWVPLAQLRARDCWETERLVCPDHVCADDAIVSCQRLLRHITKQLSSLPPQQQLSSSSSSSWDPGLSILFALIQQDLPITH